MSQPKLIDSHCHLPMIEAEGGTTAVINAARAAGVERMLCVAVDLATFPQVRQVAYDFECVSASVGVHPNTQGEPELSVEALAGLAEDPEVVAIGETGLDYYRSEGDLEWQRQRFRRHVRAAKEIGKPLIIHSREARGETLRILAEEKAETVGGVMHCFVDDLDTARQAMDLDFYISFSGIVTFKNAPELREVARQVPLERLLVETDAPFLAPAPHRGKQNEPAYVRFVAEKIAELHQVELAQVAAAVCRNYAALFGGEPQGPA